MENRDTVRKSILQGSFQEAFYMCKGNEKNRSNVTSSAPPKTDLLYLGWCSSRDLLMLLYKIQP